MKYFLKALLAALILSCLFLGYIGRAQAAVKTQNIAPDFKLQDLGQKVFSLSSYRNKQPVFLFFWTTWCPFCRRGLRDLNDSYPELAQKGWEVLAIDTGEPAEKVKRFADSYSLKFNVLLDQDLTVANAYDVLGVPTYVLIDKGGLIVFKDNYFPAAKLGELTLE